MPTPMVEMACAWNVDLVKVPGPDSTAPLPNSRDAKSETSALRDSIRRI